MLIVNADDWGASRVATDNTLKCYDNGRITSASAMVFMSDSERAAELARNSGLKTGLHLNFTEHLIPSAPPALRARHEQIASFLCASALRPLVYNPLLRGAFDYVYKAQYEEYSRLYGTDPTHIDGHHHMHLCLNVVADKILPRGCRLRISFTFFPEEKSFLNRLYRRALNSILHRRHICADEFYSVEPVSRSDRVARIFNQATEKSVELMVHPSREVEFAFLMSDEFGALLQRVRKGTYSELN
jgi:chitin disaccharide deacetylase